MCLFTCRHIGSRSVTKNPEQDPALAQTMRAIKVVFFIGVGVCVIGMLALVIRSCEMAQIRSVADTTTREAGSKGTDGMSGILASQNVIKIFQGLEKAKRPGS